jgi:hypothetical protein
MSTADPDPEPLELKDKLRGRCIREFPLLLGYLELLDEVVEPVQRLVEGHERA